MELTITITKTVEGHTAEIFFKDRRYGESTSVCKTPQNALEQACEIVKSDYMVEGYKLDELNKSNPLIQTTVETKENKQLTK